MAKKKTGTGKNGDAWDEARRTCRLSSEEILMAKELGMSPQSLIKNRPNRSEPWKAPVNEWVRELYRKKFGNKAAKSTEAAAAPPKAPRENALGQQLLEQLVKVMLDSSADEIEVQLNRDELEVTLFSGPSGFGGTPYGCEEADSLLDRLHEISQRNRGRWQTVCDGQTLKFKVRYQESFGEPGYRLIPVDDSTKDEPHSVPF